MEKRDLLHLLGLGAGLTIFGTGDLALSEGLSTARTTLPISPFDFRNAGSILGLEEAASEKLVSGTGVYFIGYSHIKSLVYYASNLSDAQNHYHQNIDHIAQEGSDWGPSPVRLWQRITKQNTFQLIHILNRG